MSRTITHRYRDPLDEIWLSVAASLGITVERSAEVFAAWDGCGTLTLSSDEHFDADDSLAQMIFHEICHALTEGEEAIGQVDWGLENTDESDLVREYACIRLQAALAEGHGLRGFFAPTTDHRPYFDALDDDVLAGEDPAAVIARSAWPRATEGPWAMAVERALKATRRIADIAGEFADDASLWWVAQAPKR